MSRRAKKIEKRVTLDPKYNSELVAHMIRVVMKDGKVAAHGPREELLPGLLAGTDSGTCSVLADKVEGVRA